MERGYDTVFKGRRYMISTNRKMVLLEMCKQLDITLPDKEKTTVPNIVTEIEEWVSPFPPK